MIHRFVWTARCSNIGAAGLSISLLPPAKPRLVFFQNSAHAKEVRLVKISRGGGPKGAKSS